MNETASDTTPQAAAEFRRLLMERSGEERVRMACDMFDTARELIVARLPRDVADDPVARKIALLRHMYGHDLESTFMTTIVNDLLNGSSRVTQ